MKKKHDPSLGDARALRNLDDHSPLSTLAATKAFLAATSSKDLPGIKDLHDRLQALTEYLKRQGAEETEVAEHAEATVMTQKRMGELLPEITGGKAGRASADIRNKGESNTPLLSDLGITKIQSSRWQKLANETPERFEGYLRRVRRQAVAATRAGAIKPEDETATSHEAGYDSDEWYTPAIHVEAAREVLGGIDLDPASNKIAQKTVKADEYFTKKDDGLALEWHGRIFLNPPYSNKLAREFADKLLTEIESGRVTSAILLQNANTDTGWFHKLAEEATALCLTRGRVPFVQSDGEPGANRYGSVFFYFGDNLRLFDQVFSLHGLVLKKVRS
jgi:phage N-6-adenine-methyltransferase